MTTTLTPVRSEPPWAPDAPLGSNVDELAELDRGLERHSDRRDGWTIMTFGVAVAALVFSMIAVGLGARAVSESKQHVLAASAAARSAAPVAVALSSVALGDMTVTPSATTVASGKYTLTITNSGKIPHELLVFHTDTAPANLAVGADGKVAEDGPGFKVSDGDNLDPGASQSRVIDLTQPGTYLFVCNLPGHFVAGMHTVVTVTK